MQNVGQFGERMYFISRLIVILLACLFFVPTQAATHHPQDFLKSIHSKPDEGEQIVDHFCANCHAVKPMIAIGAPRIGQQQDWKIRFNQGAKRLFQHTEEGFNAMPPRGGCFECSDEQLFLAIVAMLPSDLKKGFISELKVYKKNK